MGTFYQNYPNIFLTNAQLALIFSGFLFVTLNFFIENFVSDAFILSCIFFAIIDMYHLTDLIFSVYQYFKNRLWLILFIFFMITSYIKYYLDLS